MKRILYYTRIFFLAVCSLFKLNIGDWVIYKGKKYHLIQGVCDPTWDMIEKDGCPRVTVHKSLFKKEISWRNITHDIGFTFSFYNGYWRGIWLREPFWRMPFLTINRWLTKQTLLRENAVKPT